ncbi:MAG: hypothetical protein EOO61_22145 [Hymenobacter sp.]|nr:MAG: hypothetical protein EOO61_22145 [Hymenobacter sp.]
MAYRHVVEGNNIVDLKWGSANPLTLTIQFMTYVSIAGPYSFAIRNNGATYAYTTSYNVATINSWVKSTLVIPGPPSGSVWASDTNVGLELFWGLHGSGSSFAAPSTTSTWSNANYITTSNQTNLGATVNSYFNLTSVQLETGTLATQFEWRPLETEMRMCQRYYEKSYPYTSVAGSTNGGNQNARWTIMYSSNNAWGFMFAIEKRAIPSVTFYNPTSGVVNQMPSVNTSTLYTVSASGDQGNKGCCTLNVSGATAGGYLYFHFTANADF